MHTFNARLSSNSRGMILRTNRPIADSRISKTLPGLCLTEDSLSLKILPAPLKAFFIFLIWSWSALSSPVWFVVEEEEGALLRGPSEFPWQFFAIHDLLINSW